jgi:3-oxoacyl-[acyl-carrier protein] reductase
VRASHGGLTPPAQKRSKFVDYSKDMPVCHLALGSNLGDRHATLDAAVRRLRAEPGSRVLAVSRWYETAPVNCPPGAGSFLNGAVTFETDKNPHDVVRFCLRVEESFGRHRTVPNSPRTLDLDVLLYGDTVVDDPPDVIVPHPRMHDRAFVLVPLAEIAPDAVSPTSKKSVRELLSAIPHDDVRPAAPGPAPPQTLAGLCALVTGSTSGIGEAVAKEFAARGAAVTTHGRRTLPGRHLVADFRDPSQIDRFAERAWGDGLDVLVCCHGADILTGPSAEKSFDDKLAELWAVDVAGTMRLCRDVGERMRARGRGVILTIGWDQSETGMAGESGQLFGAVKGAVTAFAKSLARTLAPDVRVNGLAPGWVRTAWGETASPTWQDRVRNETPLAVWGLPQDVAAAAAWLADPAAAFVTGQTIRINGGAVR